MNLENFYFSVDPNYVHPKIGQKKILIKMTCEVFSRFLYKAPEVSRK